MPIKSDSYSEDWTASWGSISYAGVNLVRKDDLDVSVSNNPGGENPFISYHYRLTGSRGIFQGPNDWAGKRFQKSGPSSFGTHPLALAPSSAWTAANIWARTNPTRPKVLLPVFWVELRDIPDMIRQAGRFLAAGRNWRKYVRSNRQTRDLATANLAFQFGWAPLVGDLYKLATFQDAVEKRRKSLNGRMKNGTIRASIPIGSSSTSGTSNRTANFGNYRNFPVGSRWTGSAKSRAIVRWVPTGGGKLLPLKDDDLRPYLLGLHPSQIAINVWEALPWTWLVDYFSNIGDFINAGNHHRYSPMTGSVVTTKRTDVYHPESTAQWDRLVEGHLSQVGHFRAPIGGSSLSATVPDLGAGQLSILSSLAYLKGGKRLGLG